MAVTRRRNATASPPTFLGDPAAATEPRGPVFYGADVDAALDALAGLHMVKDTLARSDKPPDEPLQRLRNLLAAHMTADGPRMDHQRRAGAWVAGPAVGSTRVPSGTPDDGTSRDAMG